MKILVTGATGFTGGHVARRLQAAGHAVRALVRPATSADALADIGIDVCRGDLCDADAVDAACRGVDQVFHIGAAFRIAGKSAQYYDDVNVGGTRHVLAAARRHDVERTVYCSTIGVHGDTGSGPATETSPLRPGDVYQRSKTAAEELARAAFSDGQPGVIFRPGGIYGPGDTRFLKLFRAVTRRRFVMIGPGTVRYQLVYIDDLVDGILRCGTMPAALGEVFILTGNESIPLNEFVRLISVAVGTRPPRWRVPLWPVLGLSYACEAVCRPLGISPPLYPRRTDFFRKERTFDIAKAKRVLGYDPQIAPGQGIQQTADWYFEQGLLSRPVEKH